MSESTFKPMIAAINLTAKAFQWLSIAAQQAGEELKRFVVMQEVWDWVAYDRAGAPYGWMRRDMQQWLFEQETQINNRQEG